MIELPVTLILLFSIATPAEGAPASASLTVHLDCLKTREGVVRIALFDSADTHLKESVDSASVSAGQGSVHWQSSDLPAGEYSLAIYHDVNDNGRLDKNFLGLPKEPYGFSNNLRARFGPPKWAKGKLTVAGATETRVCVE
ncbi:MAG: DUF2141 domain-containing protein [Acidobacteriota bacterium]